MNNKSEKGYTYILHQQNSKKDGHRQLATSTIQFHEIFSYPKMRYSPTFWNKIQKITTQLSVGCHSKLQ